MSHTPTKCVLHLLEKVFLKSAATLESISLRFAILIA